jgi:thiol-disulfide isomerase/thioredoxin
MKKLFSFLIVALFTITVNAQQTIPAVNIQTIDFEPFNTSKIENDGNPVIISFWATWCSPCKRELNTISDMYEDWVDETGVKIIAISIDDARNMSKVPSYVNGVDWDYEVYLDPNGDLKRAMGVNTVPHTFLLNGNGEIVWQHTGYQPGDENHLYDLVVEVAETGAIKEAH